MADRRFKPNPFIVARFFERLRGARAGRLGKTRLQVATGLKWSLFARYLDRLLDLGLLTVEEDSGDIYIKGTDRGWELYHSLLRVLDELIKEE